MTPQAALDGLGHHGLDPPVAASAATKPVTVDESRRIWTEKFRACGIESPELDARILIGHALDLDHAALVASGTRTLTAAQVRTITALAQRRLAREPVARITGSKEFWSLRLAVNEATLVPRPDTEIVVEAALAALDRRGARSGAWRIADLGTGSGAILLALLTELPNSFGVGSDIDAAAIAIACGNARRLGVSGAAFLACDMAAALRGPFDVVVSNPPYVATGDLNALPPEVRLFDPRAALDGGLDGLDCYRAVAAAAASLLAPRGILVVELGAGQAEPVARLIAAAGLAPLTVRPDLNGVTRALVAENAV
jgi:release factor glutamine methyltransferase